MSSSSREIGIIQIFRLLWAMFKTAFTSMQREWHEIAVFFKDNYSRGQDYTFKECIYKELATSTRKEKQVCNPLTSCYLGDLVPKGTEFSPQNCSIMRNSEHTPTAAASEIMNFFLMLTPWKPHLVLCFRIFSLKFVSLNLRFE